MLGRASYAALAGSALALASFAARPALAQSAPTGAMVPTALTPTVVALTANDLAFDPTRQVLYASVPSTASQYGNTIVTIDPSSGKVTSSVAIGSEPGPLALSDDGHYLYVGLNGANAVCPLDLTTGKAGQSFAIGSGPATEIAVLPGQPTAVAVSSGGALTIYDNGVARSKATSWANTINSLAFASSTLLYGYDNTDTGFDLSTVAIGATGATVSRQDGCLVTGFGARIKLDGARVYGGTGQVVDVSGPTPVMAGTCILQSPWGSTVAPDATRFGCVFFAESNPQGSGDVIVEAFDTGSFVRLFTIDCTGVRGTPASLVTLDGTSGGLAFRTDQGQVVVLHATLLPPVSGATPAPVAGPAGSGATVLALVTNTLAYDSSRGLVYATVPSSSPVFPNTVVAIDATKGTITSAIPVGSEPRTLALSDDRSTLYVGLDGAAAVRSVDLTTMTAGSSFSLGADNFLGPYYPGEMAVLPGQTGSVAVVQLCHDLSPAAQHFSIFDNGVARAQNVGFGGTGNLIDSIGFGSAPNVIYAYNNEDTGFDFYTLTLGANGVTKTTDTGNLIGGFGVEIVVQGSRVYATNGPVVDVSGSTPRLAGTFALSGQAGRAASVAPDATLGRVFFAEVSSTTGDVAVEAFDPTTFTRASLVDLTGINGNPSYLLSVGGGRFFLRTDQGQVVSFSNALLTSGTTASGSPASPPSGPTSGGPASPPAPPAPPVPPSNPPSPTTPPPTIYGHGLNPQPSPTPPPSSSPPSTSPPASIVSAPGPASPSSPQATLVTPVVLQLTTNDLCYDKTRGILYASVPSTAPSYGNTVVSIDPTTGNVLGALPVGSEPSRLAISDDGSRLYVSLVGAAAVQAIDLAAGALSGGPFTIGSDPNFGPFVAGDLAVLPGQPNSVAVVRMLPGISVSTNGVAIYDGGVLRGTPTSNFTWVDSISFGASASVLYGYDSESSGFELFTLGVGSSGVTVGRTDSNLIGGYGVEIHFDSGTVYGSSGQAVNVTGAAPRLAGTFVLAGGAFGRGIATDVASSGRIYFVEDGGSITGSTGSDVLVEAFDPATFTRVAFYDVAGVPGDPAGLVRWGANGLAFHTDSNQLVLVADATLVPGTGPAAPVTGPLAPVTGPTPAPSSSPPPGFASANPGAPTTTPSTAFPASTASSTPAASTSGGGSSGGCEVARTQGSPATLLPLGALAGLLVLARRRRMVARG